MGPITRTFVLLAAIVALAIAGCAEPREAFVCTSSDQCQHAGQTGTCQSTGFCSFDDRGCPSGQRYGESASEDYADECVVNPNGDFIVASATALTYTSFSITFSHPPDPAEAALLSNYTIDGLSVTGGPTLSGNTVSFTSVPQSDTTYAVSAANITRASDNAPLWMGAATFKGRPEFAVVSAVSATNGLAQVVFTGPPDPTTGTVLSNYSIPGLTLSGTPIIVGNTVTLVTSPQAATSYQVTVGGVVRAGDTEALTNNIASFTGRLGFNVVSASAPNSVRVVVTFDAPPNAAQATTLANYSIPGLTLSGAPVLSGSTVTLTTSAQAATTYTVTVSGVTRETDAEPLITAAANFTGVNTFNVVGATALSPTSVRVTFDAPPNATQATTLANYAIPGLTLSGTPVLAGSQVTLTTSVQTATIYTLTVSNVTRATDAEPMTVNSTMFPGRPRFNVMSATSLSATSMRVTFDAAPNPTQAMTLGNYNVPGLTLSGTPTVSGNDVTITTSPQGGGSYTVTVSNVTRNSDAEPLFTNTATFTGRTPFNVASAASVNANTITVTFDAAPNAAQATTVANYTVSGLTLSAPVLSGNTVTFTTTNQAAMSYTVMVSNVTRASDSEPLTVSSRSFTGRAPFNVMAAVSLSATSIRVTFDAPPTAASATTLGNYNVPGLTLSGTPVFSGNAVTITTSVQSAISYTVTVNNVTRNTDAEPLLGKTATFTGRTRFNVMSATSLSATSVRVTFDAAPNTTQAAVLSNYVIPGLTLSGTPVVSGSTVTITTSPQGTGPYTVTVNTNVTRQTDGELLFTNTATFAGRVPFNVLSAASTGTTKMTVTFDAAPNAAQATTLANYTVSGLTLSAPSLSGNTVTFTTTTQSAISYTVMVANVTRSSDSEPLTLTSASFTGRTPFNVMSAAALTSASIRVTFDAAPNPTQATTLGNYTVPGLTLSGTPSLSGNTVTITTTAQSNTSYTVMVSNVTRALDSEPLSTTSATFAGRLPFNVQSATSLSSTSVRVTFDAAPNVAQATTLTNYAIPGLTLSGTPTLSGNNVTITTSPQSGISYTVTVSNVTRNTDSEAMTGKTATFTGRAPFNVAGAASTSNTRITVTFDAAPNAAQATTLTNYTVPGLTLSGAPTLSGNTVTITTSTQLEQSYTVTVNNVTRSLDAEALTIKTATFTGRAQYNVMGANSTTNTQITVTFTHAPNATQAVLAANYSISGGLTVTGAGTLSGNTVTLPTSMQAGGTPYTVTVNANVTRASDGELLTTNTAMFTGKTGFNVSSASSVNTTTMSVTFDAAPNSTQATTISNYNVPGLTLSGTPVLSGNTVTITTSAQAGQTYTVTVSNVTRQVDGVPLVVNTANFTHILFNVSSAVSLSARSISLTFDAAPNATQATTAGNYTFSGGLTVTGTPVLSGNTVTIPTSDQAAASFTVTVSNVTRNSDGTILSNNMATFTGRPPFTISAMAPTSGSLQVTYSDPPVVASATTLGNYNVPGLTLMNPVLTGNTVTFTTTAQAAQMYTVTVSNVLRLSDGEPLTVNTANFSGTALQAPTVTNVVVNSTLAPGGSGANGTTFYNTGTATVTITGTEFTGVNCLTGVTLDDTNGVGAAVSTTPTTCTVVNETTITATFPSGIKPSYTGWNVRVTNSIGTNATSTVKLVVKAGLLVSEILTHSGGGSGDDNEYVEIYNPTATSLNLSTLGVGFHVRTAAGTNTNLTLTYTRTTIPSRGFFLITSTGTANNDSWDGQQDAQYNSGIAQMVDNGGVYISLSTTANAKVIDKVGWGTQAANGFETTALPNISNAFQVSRKPAGGLGHATDTDVNSVDFNAQTSVLTHRNSLSAPQP